MTNIFRRTCYHLLVLDTVCMELNHNFLPSFRSHCVDSQVAQTNFLVVSQLTCGSSPLQCPACRYSGNPPGTWCWAARGTPSITRDWSDSQCDSHDTAFPLPHPNTPTPKFSVAIKPRRWEFDTSLTPGVNPPHGMSEVTFCGRSVGVKVLKQESPNPATWCPSGGICHARIIKSFLQAAQRRGSHDYACDWGDGWGLMCRVHCHKEEWTILWGFFFEPPSVGFPLTPALCL